MWLATSPADAHSPSATAQTPTSALDKRVLVDLAPPVGRGSRRTPNDGILDGVSIVALDRLASEAAASGAVHEPSSNL
jgi:hypothetical protein